MNLLKKIKLYKHRNIKIKKEKNGIIISSKKDDFVIFSKVFRKGKYDNAFIEFSGKIEFGDAPEIKLINRRSQVIQSLEINSTNIFDIKARVFIVAIKVKANSKFIINKLDFKYSVDQKQYINQNFNGDTLVISPGYPSYSNKYLFSFVHTRVLEYKKNNYKVDVAYLSEEPEYKNYNFEGVDVNKISYFELRNLLQVKKYKKIIVQFFTNQVAQILDATDISDVDLYLFTHGSDILYRDINILNNKYFTPISKYTESQIKDFEEKDKIINRYNDMPNVKFIFASSWAKQRSEEQNNIKYKNYEILPTYIDGEIFKYKVKDKNLRKKIVIIRKFDNLSTYSIDINVRTILELSKKDYFNDLEFDIYGDGEYHYDLLKPLRKFSNVHIYKKFLTHSEMAEVYSKHGIALFATRYETQGVSAAEAAMNGVVVISNDVAAVPEMFDGFDTICPKEDYIKMANTIEKIYKDPKYFSELSEKMHKHISEKYGYQTIMKKELQMLSKKLQRKEYKFKKLSSKKVLTIAVASYNVEKFLSNSIQSLINSSVAEKLEILIINDGSKDNTGLIASNLQKLTTVDNDSIVKFIDKENGGHGSAINKGIELATGKYFKLMDGDDYFDTSELEKLVGYLDKENTDIILNNYVEDLSVPCTFNPIRHYEFMEPGKEYNIDDLCYDGYGFDKWGPLLSTSTYKTEMLKAANFKISEHCFYVDMELNSIAFTCAQTIKYYPLNIYIYYLGRVGQSVSAASFKKNYKNHEHVTLRIIKDIYYGRNLNEEKKNYLKNKIIIPLIKTQYLIIIDYFDNGKPFMEFDRELRKYPEFYNSNLIVNRRIKLYRKTGGKFIKLIKLISNLKHKITKH